MVVHGIREYRIKLFAERVPLVPVAYNPDTFLPFRGFEIRDLRITLDGDIDLHTFLGLADGHAGFSAIRVVVHLDTDADEATVAELHRKVAATSPVGQTLSKAIPVEITHQ